MTEAAIVVGGHPLDDLATAQAATASAHGDSVYGLTKLLMECHVQFDVVEPDTDLEGYRLLVLPDNLPIDAALADRFRAYLRNGGAVIAEGRAILLGGSDTVWAEGLGLTDRGESPFAPAYLKFAQPARGPDLFAGLPDYEYALYDGARQWHSTRPEVVLARLSEPLFQRGPAHYTSHAQTPFDHLTDFAAVMLDGRLAATAFPIGASYYRHGYWIYREIFQRLARAVLPERLIETNAPLSAEVTVTHQAATAERPARWLVHLVNFSPNRRSPEHCEYLEDPIPLRDVRVALHVDGPINRAYTATDGASLPLHALDRGWEVTVPRVDFGAIAVWEA